MINFQELSKQIESVIDQQLSAFQKAAISSIRLNQDSFGSGAELEISVRILNGIHAVPINYQISNEDGSLKNTTILESKLNHHGHEIVENTAGGNVFKYCRNCKVEVLD